MARQDWTKAKSRHRELQDDRTVEAAFNRMLSNRPKPRPDRTKQREAADDAIAAFIAKGGQVKRVAAQAAPQPKHGGRGLRKWRKGSPV